MYNIYTHTTGEKLGDAARRSGLNVPYGCKQGVCGTCEAVQKQPNGQTVQIKVCSATVPKTNLDAPDRFVCVLCVFVHACVCIYTYLYLYIYIYIYISCSSKTPLNIAKRFVHMFYSIHIYIHAHIYICTRSSQKRCKFWYIHTYIHKHTRQKSVNELRDAPEKIINPIHIYIHTYI